MSMPKKAEPKYLNKEHCEGWPSGIQFVLSKMPQNKYVTICGMTRMLKDHPANISPTLVKRAIQYAHKKGYVERRESLVEIPSDNMARRLKCKNAQTYIWWKRTASMDEIQYNVSKSYEKKKSVARINARTSFISKPDKYQKRGKYIPKASIIKDRPDPVNRKVHDEMAFSMLAIYKSGAMNMEQLALFYNVSPQTVSRNLERARMRMTRLTPDERAVILGFKPPSQVNGIDSVT